jgi:hypothetical protein
MPLEETALKLVVTTFPCGTRDFLLVQPCVDSGVEVLHPLQLLELDRTARVIERVKQRQTSLALVIALCRLLVPCLRYRGSGRHLVAEPWALADLRGESLPVDVRTPLARELSAEQADEFQAVTAGQWPPEGSLAELFWAAQTDLPALPPVFNDPELGRLAKALYFYLIPEGQGLVEAYSPALVNRVEKLRAEGFASLQLGIPPRHLQPAFRKLLAVTVRYTSQLTGAVAEELINQRLHQARRPRLTPAEKEVLSLRYGACRALNDINVGFLFGCGPLLADLVNDYFLTLAGVRPAEDRARAEELLRAFVYLLGGFQRRRKLARAHERREDRQHHADRMPVGPRHQAEFQPDPSVPPPEVNAIVHEEMDRLRDLLPLLKERDAERLRAFIDCNGDRKAAAARLGLSPTAYSRQLRQTVLPAVRKLARTEGFDLLS